MMPRLTKLGGAMVISLCIFFVPELVRVADPLSTDKDFLGTLKATEPMKAKKVKPKIIIETNEIIIKYNRSIIDLSTPEGIEQAHDFVTYVMTGVTSKEKITSDNLELLVLAPDAGNVLDKIIELQTHSEVEYAQPNAQYRPVQGRPGKTSTPSARSKPYRLQ